MEGNVFDYIEWRGDLTFEERPLNVVDALIFECLTYVNFPVLYHEEKTVRQAFSEWKGLPSDKKFRGIDSMKSCMDLAEKCASSARFKDIVITRYIEKISEKTEKQFSAMTFLLPGSIMFAAIRGTDNTLVGWKEDFNMSFKSSTPAQLEAANYVSAVAEDFPGYSLNIGGHSKGGNLSVWAAAHQNEEITARIDSVYNDDGPGFTSDFIESNEYAAVKSKILSFVPESSIVGVLMSHGDYRIIKSDKVSVLQHDPFSWKINVNDFIYLSERSKSGNWIEKQVNDMIASMSPEEIQQFVDEVFDSLKKYDAKTLDDLKGHSVEHIFNTLVKFGKFKAKSDENIRRKNELSNQDEK